MSTSGTVTVELDEPALNIGIEVTGRDISSRFALDTETLNAHIGQYDGQGPRYGMAPLPGHAHNDVTGLLSRGLRQSEVAGLDNRKKFYGLVPLSVASSTDPTVKLTCYFWFLASGNAGVFSFAFAHGSSGLSSVYEVAAGLETPFTALATVASSTTRVQNYRISGALAGLVDIKDRNYSKCIAFAVTGRKIPLPVFFGTALSDGTATTPPGVNFNRYGVPKDYVNKSFSFSPQKFEVQVLNNQSVMVRKYEYDQAFTASLVTSTTSESDTTTSQLNLPAAPVVTTGITALSSAYALFKSQSLSVTSEYYLLASAPGKAVMAVYQDWVRGTAVNGPNFQYVDPVRIVSAPPSRTTLDPVLVTNYQEVGVAKKTCWDFWPNFDGVTALAADPGKGFRTDALYVGSANSGILRRNTVYEFAYSIYDKSTAHETNVGVPALILTGAADYVRFMWFGYADSGVRSSDFAFKSPWGYLKIPIATGSSTPTPFENDFINRLNMIQYRFYYRARGAYEWLPAAQIDATHLFDATVREIWLCEGAYAGTVGGQPGGFNDYSALPDEAYFDVAQYRERLFWMSAKGLAFSKVQDYFSYPVTNAAACPSGQFKGILPHAYPGQAQQDSRLMIFTSEQIAVGRFRGQEYATVQTVRVSENASTELPVDGSDFTIDTWTTQTAFSSRSAVVAQGILYYWGPTGIYKDMGNTLPTKDWSEFMEPLLFSLYDPTDTDNIHAVYNDRMKEIIWFFRPSSKNPLGHASNVQKALVYKVTWGSFHLWDFGNTLIDAAQVVDTQVTNTSAKGIAGSRVVVMIRDALNLATPQRAAFLDELCDSGDVTANTMLLVKQVSLVGANARLTLAEGYSATLPSTGTLTISGYRDYRDTLAVNPDGLYTIAGSNGTTYIDIAPLASVSFPTVETIATKTRYFPIWVESLNGFDFRIKSTYWAPRGLRAWQRWLYCYQSYKVDLLLPSGGQAVRLKFYSVLGTGNSQRDITFVDNSRGNMQAHSQIVFSQQNAEGPALSIELTSVSGKHCGSRWYVQYLSFDLAPMTLQNFKTWEA